MNNYNFSTINDKDFEILVLDLLNEEFNLNLQDFKVGKDKGIDLRFSTSDNNNSIVVQAKHYLKSSVKTLLRKLEKEELPKVLYLKPDRYIIATSQELSAKEKDYIKNLFTPYIKTSNDVFSSQDFNKLLRKHKNIEKKHFKLWFSSSHIISNILNNAIEGRTKSYLERIKLKIPLYVLTANLDQANKILLKEKVLLITGDPGVGKTTLAEVILFEKAKAKYRIHTVNTIREAEDMISVNNKEKQIFYFDDFLGEVYYEIIAGSQKENEVAQFVDRIKNSPNKFLILSTRTVILEQAKSKSEKIKRSKIESGKYEIILGKYTNFEKAKILYNHLYFQSIKENLFKAIIEDNFFMYIIKHKNYTPRIIEFITQKERIQSFTKFEYTEFIKRHLTYPEEIWEDSYLNQIEYLDRCLLQTLFTFGKGISESLLRKAFENRLDFEKNINNKQISSEQFESSVRNLLHGFITSSITNIDDNLKQFSFVNPSISDFLISYFNKNYSIKKATVQSIKYVEQLSIFNPGNDNFKFEIELQKIVKSNIQNDKYDSIGDYKKYKFIGQKMEILMKFCSEIDTDNSLLELLKDIEYKNIWWIRNELYFVMNQVNANTKSYDYIEINFLKIMESYIEQIEDEELALSVKKLFKKYGHSFKDFSSNEIYQDKLISLISKVSIEKEKSLVSIYEEDIENWDDYNTYVYDEIEVIKAKLSKSLLPKNISIDIPHHYRKEELEEQILINKKERKKANYREQKAEQLYHEFENTTIRENKRIEDLFYRKK